jgi:hypothetical protein
MFDHLKKPAAVLAVVALTACGGNGDHATVDTGEGSLSANMPKATSMVRMVNALPNMDGLQVTSDDRAVFSGVDYKAVTQYQQIDETFARFRLQSGNSDTTIATNNELLIDGSRYTIVALPQEDGGVRLRVLKDELTPDEGKARFRVIHAVPNAGEVDVLLTGSDEPIFDNLNYGNEGGFKDVDPGNTTVTIRTDEGKRQVVKQQMNFVAGHAYTMVITTKAGKTEVIAIDDRAPTDK